MSRLDLPMTSPYDCNVIKKQVTKNDCVVATRLNLSLLFRVRQVKAVEARVKLIDSFII